MSVSVELPSSDSNSATVTMPDLSDMDLEMCDVKEGELLLQSDSEKAEEEELKVDEQRERPPAPVDSISVSAVSAASSNLYLPLPRVVGPTDDDYVYVESELKVTGWVWEG